MMDEQMWYNYRTEQFENVKIGQPIDFTDYIPQDQASQGMYRVLLHMGKSREEACLEVLTKHVEVIQHSDKSP